MPGWGVRRSLRHSGTSATLLRWSRVGYGATSGSCERLVRVAQRFWVFGGDEAPGGERAGHGQGCAGQQDEAETCGESCGDGVSDRCRIGGIQAGGQLQCSELDFFGADGVENFRREREGSQVLIEVRGEGLDHENSESGDGQHTGHASDGVIDAGSYAGVLLIDGAHNDGGERGHGDGHAQSEDQRGGEEGGPVAPVRGREAEKKKTRRDDKGTDHQREPWTVAGYQSAGP